MNDETYQSGTQQHKLRGRIANAIYEASDEYTQKLMVNPRLPGSEDAYGDYKPICYQLADAVIAELNLKIVVDYSSADRQRRNFMLAGNYTTEEVN